MQTRSKLPQVFLDLVPAMAGTRLGQLENRGHVLRPLEDPGIQLDVLSGQNGAIKQEEYTLCGNLQMGY